MNGHQRRRVLPCALTMAATLAVAQRVARADSTDVSYPDFSDVSHLTLNGDATTATTSDGTVLRLTSASAGQSGSAFSTTQLNAASFSTFFKFRITDPGGTLFDGNTQPGADGLVFVVQSVSSSIGGSGLGIGYAGIANSVGVEFDTWHNTVNNDPNSNHLGIDIDGNVNHGVGAPHTVNVTPDFDDGNIWYAWVDYNDNTDTLEVRASQNSQRPTNALLSENLALSTILAGDTAYVGFTSGTGSDWGNHDILGWTYRQSYNPIDGGENPSTVPLPQSALTIPIGLLLAGAFCMRRRRRIPA